MAEQGQYPVIRLSFNGADCSNWESAQNCLAEYFSNFLRPFDYLQHSDRLLQADKDELWSIRTRTAEPTLLRKSLRLLSELLHIHHGKPVVLLIDEYDVPIQLAYKHGFYEDMIGFMRAFFASGLKDNPHLRLAVLTGVMRIAKESLFSGLNNLEVDTVLSKDYADCFGFTQAEVEAMADDYSVPDKISEIRAWYDGYRFGQLDIYNPWSVLNYFKHGYEATMYWLDTSGNDLVIDFLRHLDDKQRQQIETLYMGGTVTATLDTAVAYRQLDYHCRTGQPSHLKATWLAVLVSRLVFLVLFSAFLQSLLGSLVILVGSHLE